MNKPSESIDSIVRQLFEHMGSPAPEVLEFLAVRSSPRSVVRRLRLKAPWGAHARIIAKQVVGEKAAARFNRELVALRFLGALEINPRVAPRLLAWDVPAQLFLLEDLGDRSLATTLFGEDRAAAHAALIAHASALGRLHASTAQQELRVTAIGGSSAEISRKLGNPRDLQDDRLGFRKLCEVAGVAVDAAFDADVNQVNALLERPGPFRVLTHGDPCPDNERLTDNGAVFFDFEASGFDHALLDAACFTMAFPTCWCVGSIPPEILAEAQLVYRRALAVGVPQAADTATFARHRLHVSARWLLSPDALVPRARRSDGCQLVDLVTADWSWGHATARQRLLYRLSTFVQLAQAVGELRGLTATAGRLHRAFASRWPSNVQRLADFPAFSGV